MDIQVHLLIHLVDDIDLAGVMSARNMFFVERFLKVLKGFVRQYSHPEGSMGEGYIVQESFFYASEYLSEMDPSAPRMWDADKDSEKLEGKVLETDGRPYSLKGITNILFIISNS